MPDINIDRTLDAPLDRFFDVMSDHGRYDRFRPISRSALIRDGDREPNGLGAVRRLGAGMVNFEEEITAFERPARFDYLITKVNLPLHHDGGSLRFESASDGTRVRWTSTFQITVPLLSRPLEALGKRQLERAFNKMLDDAEALAQA